MFVLEAFLSNSSLSFPLGFRLNVTVLMAKIVSQRIDCILECSIEPCCRSVNYKADTTFKNETNCEMLHNLVNNNTHEKLLQRNTSYDHVSLLNPYKVKYRMMQVSLQGVLLKAVFGQPKSTVQETLYVIWYRCNSKNRLISWNPITTAC